MPAASPLKTRLLAKLVKSAEPDGCWVFTGARDPRGYGRIGSRNAVLVAHRAAYEVFVGPIPSGLQVCHKCDNPPCCRPNHLFLGTPLDNVRDCVNKGRFQGFATLPTKGEKNGQAKLTEAAVLHIRAYCTGKYGQQIVMARLYGVDKCTINDIVRGRQWRHLLAQAS